MYDPQEIDLPPSFLPEHPFDNGEMVVRDEKLAPWPRTADDVRRHTAEYYAMITHLDHQIGRVLQVLKSTGHAEDTIVVLAGDNGLAIGRHGLFGKQNMYEHSLHVPLIMSGPGVPQNQRTDSLCYLLDIYPTLCELLDIPTPSSVEGESLVPALREPNAAIRDTLTFAYRGVQRAARDARFKLIEYVVDGQRTTQLFDLRADPWETNSLTDSSLYAGHLTRMRVELERSRDALDDNQPDQGEAFWQGYDRAALAGTP
jgi:arylsulfatase A-like enzyme